MSIELTQSPAESAEIRKAEAIIEFVNLIKIPAFTLLSLSSILVPVWLIANL